MKRAVKVKKPARAKTRHYSVKASDWRAAFSMPPDLDEVGLRQWCVAQAILRPQSLDLEVMTRAAKIYRWVTGKDA